MTKNFNSKYSTDNLLVVFPIGGKATRLLPLTEDISKPLIPLFNKPLIDSLLFSLSKQGLKNFILGTQGYVNSIDLYEAGSFINESLCLQDKIDFITCIYEVAYADNNMHFLERHTINQILNILNINRDQLKRIKDEVRKDLI